MAKLILVNDQKVRRAERILALVSGKTQPRTREEDERLMNYSKILADAKIDANSEEAVEFLYRRFGGLGRTEAEQKDADKKKKEMQLKGKKDKLGLK